MRLKHEPFLNFFLLEDSSSSLKRKFSIKISSSYRSFLIFSIFLGLYDFSYHLNTTSAIKLAQDTYFRAGKKEPLCRKSGFFFLQMPLSSIQLLFCSPQLCPFQLFIFFLRRKGVAGAIFRSTDSQSFMPPYSHQAEMSAGY